MCWQGLGNRSSGCYANSSMFRFLSVYTYAYLGHCILFVLFYRFGFSEESNPISNCLLIMSQLVYFSHVCIASYNSDFFFFIDGYSILITRSFCTCFNTLRVIKTKKTL